MWQASSVQLGNRWTALFSSLVYVGEFSIVSQLSYVKIGIECV